MSKITKFTDDYSFLSNFFPCAIIYEGITYLNSESAFQAAKCADIKDRQQVQALSPGEAKKAGKKVKLRPDWERTKVDVMREIIRIKFSNNPQLAENLRKTGDAELIEGNCWHDNFWGDCECERCGNIPGKNWLGKLLMEYRATILTQTIACEKQFYGFSCLSRQSYGEDYIRTTTLPKGYSNEILFGVYVENDGCISEAAVRWATLGNNEIPRFEVFTDGLKVLYHLFNLPQFKDFVQKLPDFTPDDFSRFLISFGFKDMSDKKLCAKKK